MLERPIRRDITGLRALAVLAVVLFHFGVPGFGSGFVGVDVFFVISGFLMTTIVADAMDGGRFSLRGFYASRVLRIAPPMLVAVATLLALGWFFIEPAEYALLGRRALAALLSIANIAFYQEADYFAPARESNWLLHLWSLSVEMQFYLVFPLLVLWAYRGGRKTRLVIACAVVLVLSLIACVVLTARDRSAAFYFMPTRIWEFLAGAMACLLGEHVAERYRPMLSWTGIAAIIVSIVALPAGVAFPGYIALLPVAGTALIAGRGSSPWVLTNPASQFIGAVSYSLYLWHWPVWVAARHYRLAFSPAQTIGLVALSLAIASASYYLVERPGRRLRHRAARVRPLLATAVAACLIAAVCGAVVRANGFPARVPAMIANVGGTMPLLARPGSCFLSPPATGDAFAAACFDPAEPRQGKSVLVWGDSHAAHLWPGFVDAAAFKPLRLLQATSGACPPLFVKAFNPDLEHQGVVFDPVTGIALHCDDLNRRALAEIERIHPDVVVLSARWYYYDMHSTDVISDLRQMIDRLASVAGAVVVVGPIPEWEPTLPQRALQETFLRGGRVPDRLDDPSHVGQLALDRRMSQALRGTRATYVSLFAALCDERACLTTATENGQQSLMTWDYSHLTAAGARWVVSRAIAPVVVGALR